MKLLCAGLSVVFFLANTFAQDVPEVSPVDLLKAEIFPEAAFGMKIESIKDGAIAKVVTTGAEFSIDKNNSTIDCHQRVAAQRKVARIKLPKGMLREAKLTHQSSGAAIFEGGGTKLRINSDSLLMIQPGQNGDIVADLQFTPDFHSESKGSFNFFDPVGGISFFEHGVCPSARMNAAKDPVTITWPYSAGQVFWAAVSPPKPFDWKKSINYRVAFHGSSEDRHMYPSDTMIVRLKHFGDHNVLYLHGEMLWENHQMSLVPKDLTGFKRMVATAHEVGMKVIVYASPHFYVKGTSLESKAHPDPHKFIGEHTGANVEAYLKAAERIVKEFGSDGLYFDEMYPTPQALAVQYYLARKARELVGDSNPLILHCTTDASGAGHFGPVVPPIYTYFDVIYKGEGEFDNVEPGYLRYVLSTYNTSNSIGVQLIDERYCPTPEVMNTYLEKGNIRFFTFEFFFYTGQIELLRKHYWPRLTDKLQAEIEPELLKPTGVFKKFRAAAKKMPPK